MKHNRIKNSCFRGILAASIVLLLNPFSANCQLTTTNINVSKDSHIRSNAASTNYGSDTLMYVSTVLKALNQSYRRSFVEFDLSSIPSNAIIYSSKIKLKRSTSISGSNPWRTKLITSSWSESTITASNQPSISTNASDISSTSSDSGDTVFFDVTDMTQRMVYGQISNYGWSIQVQNEAYSGSTGSTFYTQESVNYMPFIEVKYYLPIVVVEAVIQHESFDGAGNGYIDPTLAYGSEDYDYEWIDGATGSVISTDTVIDSLNYGWYGLHVTGAYGEELYQAFLVGLHCDTAEIEFSPGPDYTEDAFIYDLNATTMATNYGDYSVILASNGTSSGSWFDARSLLKFNLWADSSINYNSADLKLTGSSKTPSLRSNDAHFKKIVSYWDEHMVTHNAQPSYSSTDIIDVPVMTSDTEIKYIETEEFWNDWKADNSSNYGMLFQLDLYDDTYAKQQYHSSDATDSTKFPLITFSIIVNYSYDTLICNPILSYKSLKRKLDGGHARTFGGELFFSYKEEYQIDTSEYLTMNMYDDDHSLIASCDRTGSTTGGMTAIKYNFDDNRYDYDVSGITGITANDYYILEVINSKGDRRYLRFIYKN